MNYCGNVILNDHLTLENLKSKRNLKPNVLILLVISFSLLSFALMQNKQFVSYQIKSHKYIK